MTLPPPIGPAAFFQGVAAESKFRTKTPRLRTAGTSPLWCSCSFMGTVGERERAGGDLFSDGHGEVPGGRRREMCMEALPGSDLGRKRENREKRRERCEVGAGVSL